MNYESLLNIPQMGIIQLILGACYTNCYIVYHKETKSCMIIDPADCADEIIQTIENNGLNPKYIVITHGHTDHVLAIFDLLKKYQTSVAISEIDAWRLLDEELINERPYVTEPYKPVKASLLLKEGDILNVDGLEFTVMIIPGHTEGSIALKIGNALFTGDTMLKGNHGKITLPGANETDIKQSLERLKALNGNYIIFPGHRELTTLDEERHTKY